MCKWAISLAALLLAACQSPPTPVQTASSAAHAAADEFVALASNSAASGQVPRQTDPTAGPVLDAIFNTAAVQGATASSGDIDAVNDWLFSAVRVGQVYLLAGTGFTDIATANASSQARARIYQNMVTYAPECGRFIDAELAIEGADATAVEAVITANPDAVKDPTTAQGFDKARGGVVETAQGVITTISGPGLPNDWREARARSLIAFAPHAAGFLTDAQKQTLGGAATQAAAGASDDPQLAALLNQFAAAITATPAA